MIDAAEDEYQEDYFSAYFGNDADYYLRKLEQYQNGQKFSFNIGAFFFGIMWMLYRKLYVLALVYVALIITQGLLLTNLAEHFHIPKQTITYVDQGLMLLWGVILGFLGNYFYLRKAKAQVRKIKAAGLGPQETVNRLAVVGGITYLPHIVLALFVFIATLVLQMK